MLNNRQLTIFATLKNIGYTYSKQKNLTINYISYKLKIAVKYAYVFRLIVLVL